MVSFLRELASLPFKLVFYITKFLRVNSTAQMTIIHWTWKIGREMEWAHLYLIYVWYIKGEEEASKIAEQFLSQEKNAYFANFIGDLEFHIRRDIESAKRWIRKAEEMDCSHPEALWYLKLRMSGAVPEYANDALVQKVLDRNDLSMEETRFAFLIRAQQFIQHKKWDQADEILDHMLRIESHDEIHIYKWITSLAKEDKVSAQKHLVAAEKMCGKEQLYIKQAIGLYWLGKFEQARDFLLKGFRDEEHRRAVLFFQPYLAELLRTEDV
jgi:tetratricopeptide (TPR) repeat protein